MKLILLTDVPKIGRKHDVVWVADGYARNVLVPQKKAAYATPAAIKNVEHLKKAAAQGHAKTEGAFEAALVSLDGGVVTLAAKANERGHLFAGVDAEEIAAAVKQEKGMELNAGDIDLPSPLKEIGEYEIFVRRGERTARFMLRIKKSE